MTFIAVSIEVTGTDRITEAVARAAAAVERGASLVEFRVDRMAGERGAVGATGRLVRECPVSCIITARSVDEGGAFDGGPGALIDYLEALLGAGPAPRYVDIELRLYQTHGAFRARLDAALDATRSDLEEGTRLILSAHDFDGRPVDLLQRVEAMAGAPRCDVIKMAWRARTIRDNLEAFDLLAARPKPMVALCMGEFGLMSRVLAGKYGGLLTFAADEPGAETAPGQPTIDALAGHYRFGAIRPETRVYGVIGWPIGHSRSPAVHNAAFAAAEHDAVFLPMPVAPEYEPFKAAVASLLGQDGLCFAGASVTLPHKIDLLRYVVEVGGRVEPSAARVGAANTLFVDGEGGIGCANTDADAAVASLRAAIPGGTLVGGRVAVFGAGGVARAVAAGLAGAGAAVALFNRSADAAAALAEDLNRHDGAPPITVAERGALAAGGYTIIVNCTSVGMAGGPEPDRHPLEVLGEDASAIDESVTVFDTVYAPEETPLIVLSRDRGARVVTGSDMFLRQAALQFERWTGMPAPMEVMRRSLEG